MLPESSSRACIVRHWVALVFCLAALTGATEAIERPRPWRPLPAKPYTLRGAERRLLDRAERFLTDQQWDDAASALMRLLKSDNQNVIAVEERRFVSLAEYCNRLLAGLPAEALARYRALVDAPAESIYRQGVEQRSTVRLQEVVDRFFCSSWGDDALLALGEIALERGDYQAARNAWMTIAGQGSSLDERLIYPGTDLPLAEVEARLVLLSIREGDLHGAESKLRRFQEDHPTARGRMGGREVILADYLAILLQQSRLRPHRETRPEWITFAANYQRTNATHVTGAVRPYELLWSREIDNEHLKVYPVVAGNRVFYQDDAAVHALSLTDGQEAFVARGSMFRSTKPESGSLGHARHTLTANDRQLFGVTSVSLGPRRASEGGDISAVLWSLDLEREGAISWEQTTDDPKVAFAGAPIVEDSRVYVPIRSNEQTARAGIACYDHSTGQLRWRRWLVQANTPATGWTSDHACQLLTYNAGVLYANTNLGAVAAVRAEDGQVLWLRTYQRYGTSWSKAKDADAYYRGPQPCIYHRGFVYVLPTDSIAVAALDASTGRVLWKSPVSDPMARLMGVQNDHLVVYDAVPRALDLSSGVADESEQSPAAIGASATIGEPLPSIDEANFAFAGSYAIAAERKKLSVFKLKRAASETTSSDRNQPKE